MMNNNLDISSRIAYIIENQYNNNKKKFAESIGYSAQVVSNIVSGRKSKPSYDVLNAIISTNDDINIEWLLTGKGLMLKSELEEVSIENNKGIPLIPLDAMAGWGKGDVQVMDYDTRRYVIPEFEELNVDFMIYVKGNSMIPRYSAGDLVACKKLPLDTFFQWNKIYVLDTIQGAMIKRIHQSDKESSIKCVSENPDYPPFDLHSDDINSIALVVGVVSFE